MLAGEAAAEAGVTVKALRYYETVGLIEPARRENGYRDYSARDIQLAAEIRALMSLGLAPKETQPFLDCLRDGHEAGDDCPESLAAYQHQIERLNVIIAQLTHSRDELTRQLRHAARRGFRSRDDDEETSEMLPQSDPLPDDLPAPQDDGAARHLPGRTLPPLALETTDGDRVQLDAVSTGRWVLYLYPLTGDPAADLPEGWDQIPGARGCSWEACGFRDNLAALQAHGAQRVLALSTDRAEYQQDLVRRLQLPYPMLSDPELSLARAGPADVPGRRDGALQAAQPDRRRRPHRARLLSDLPAWQPRQRGARLAAREPCPKHRDATIMTQSGERPHKAHPAHFITLEKLTDRAARARRRRATGTRK